MRKRCFPTGERRVVRQGQRRHPAQVHSNRDHGRRCSNDGEDEVDNNNNTGAGLYDKIYIIYMLVYAVVYIIYSGKKG